jgi:hypothetical protein
MKTDDEQSRATLRQEQRSIDHQWSKTIALVGKCRANCCHVLARVGSNSSVDVFQYNCSRRPFLFVESFD